MLQNTTQSLVLKRFKRLGKYRIPTMQVRTSRRGWGIFREWMMHKAGTL